jgi:uncharacterized protein YdiU (UPF0061 family)
MQHLHKLHFEKAFTDQFPGDDSGDKRPRQTPGKLYSTALPTPVKAPELIGWSSGLAAQLGILPPDNDDVAVLGGNLVTPTMNPYAACYAGHQFGNWAGQLGDGRAITLGEHRAPDGKVWELQLKGAGPTAYSRRADGRAVLRSSVREYLLSEAMHHLGVPTTRALALVRTGDEVMRDMFYNGNAAFEPGAIVMRVAPSFLRFGNFEMAAARRETENLEGLVDWTISRYYPHLTGEDRLLRFFEEVVDRTAFLMTEWLRVGFVHGVMNTDNMSILGLSIDYGPFSFLDDYDPNFTPNTTDLPGRRYAFGRQPSVAYWNLGCLAGALAVLTPEEKPLVEGLHGYETALVRHYREMMRKKLGLDEVRKEDAELFSRFETVLTSIRPDMTLFYLHLAEAGENTEDALEAFGPTLYTEPSEEQRRQLSELISAYRDRIRSNRITPEARRVLMRQSNPRIILRNYQLHEAIEALQEGDAAPFNRLAEALQDPYGEGFDDLVAKRPDWATQKAGCSMLSCSS